MLWKKSFGIKRRIGMIIDNISPNINSYNWVVGKINKGFAKPGKKYFIRIKGKIIGERSYYDSERFTLKE